MTKTHDIARYDYAGIDGCLSCCQLEIWQGPGRIPVVLATERLDNDGTSITNWAEHLAEQVCREFDLEPRSLIYLEAYEREGEDVLNREMSALTNRGGFDRVCFRVMHDGHLDRPTWKAFGLKAAEQLVGEQL